MQWQTLYSSLRAGEFQKAGSSPETTRTSFTRDYDRLIFSSAFRRLQNKTQVFPLPGAVFVHNRLTHSLEVASVGRSLGKACGDALADKYPGEGEAFREFYKYELPNVIAAACLAHDIGNPPFGHSGEDAIRHFFLNWEGEGKKRFEQWLSPAQQADFLRFEGNANAFRTLTYSFGADKPGGYRLTFTTLASIVKYPCSSACGFNKSHLFTKKSGFFQSELSTWEAIAQSLGIPRQSDEGQVFARHPFVYLVEAADDICYRITDFEDAHRLGIISLNNLSDLFLAFFDDEVGYNARHEVEAQMRSIHDANQKVQFLRARLINLLANQMSQIFLQNEEKLLNGSLDQPLINGLSAKNLALMASIDDYSLKHIYNHRSVVEIEVAGYHVIGSLLAIFTDALWQPQSGKARKLLQLIPSQFPLLQKPERLYSDLQSIVDFVAGMTDLYAVDLYRKIQGISLSGFG